jgi:RimJ/RimL family protein N-acetyltransferase
MTTPATSAPTTDAATVYEIRVAGHLDDHWSTMLGALTLTRCPDGSTTLTGPVDQAQLHGVLARVRDVGATLLGVRTLADTSAQPVEPALTHLLRTDRLTLRPATAADADATWKYRRLSSVGTWLTEVPVDLEAHRAMFADPARLASTVIVEHDGDLIGDFMLRVEDSWASSDVADQARNTRAELGWVLDPAHTGHGYATEAVRGILEYCFGSLGR